MPGQVQLIGVHPLSFDEAMVSAQAQILYGDHPSRASMTQIRRQLKSAVLVEVLVTGADSEFDVGDFAQEDPNQPRENWQAPWAEAYLSLDGEQLLVDRGDPLPTGQSDFRVAFYMHGWRVGQALLSSYGPVATGPASLMPERLGRLVPYELLD